MVTVGPYRSQTLPVAHSAIGHNLAQFACTRLDNPLIPMQVCIPSFTADLGEGQSRCQLSPVSPVDVVPESESLAPTGPYNDPLAQVLALACPYGGTCASLDAGMIGPQSPKNRPQPVQNWDVQGRSDGRMRRCRSSLVERRVKPRSGVPSIRHSPMYSMHFSIWILAQSSSLRGGRMDGARKRHARDLDVRD